jgi:hypothetical protein
METKSTRFSGKRFITHLAFMLAAIAAPSMAQIYNTGDIAVINNIIEKNGLLSGAHIYKVRNVEAAEVRVDVPRGIYIIASGEQSIKVFAQ